MTRLSVDLGNINKYMRIQFHVIVDFSPTIKGKTFPTFRTVLYAGNEYISVNGRPYIKLDISKGMDRGDAWNSSSFINLNQRGTMLLIQSLGKMIEAFQEKRLFFTQYGVLYVQTELASQFAETVVCNGKAIHMLHAVVPDEDNRESFYEGIVMMINSPDNYVLLTLEDIYYLREVLQGINFTSLQMELINTYLLTHPEAKLDESSPVVREFQQDSATLPAELDNKYVAVQPKEDAIPKI